MSPLHDQPTRSPAALSAELWHESLDAMDAAIVLYDQHDRIVVCNRNFRSLYKDLDEFIRPGTTFEALLRRSVELGLQPQSEDDVEAFVAHRLAQHANPSGPILRQFADGRWRRITEQRLGNGGLLAFSIDVTELVESRQALQEARDEARRSTQRLEDAVEALPEGFALFDAADRLVTCNQRYRDMYALSAPAMTPGSSFETILRYGLARGQYPMAEGRQEDWIEERLHRHRHPDQPVLQELPGNRWVRVDERRSRQGWIAGVRTDVTELVRRGQQLEKLNASLVESRAQLRAIIGTALSAIVTIDEQDRILSANPATQKIFGWPPNDLVGQPLTVLLPSFRAPADQSLHADSSDGGMRIDALGRHRTGAPLAVQLALSRLNMAGSPRYVALITDLSEREAAAQALLAANARLARLSETDPLTNIANRRRFDHELRDEWLRSARDGTPLGLLIVDVDHFKRYNDSAGHPAGDSCLQRIAELLQASVQRSTDLVARYGGEEFALLLPRTDLEQAMTIARGCIDSVEHAAIPHPDSPLGPHVTLSIGVASIYAHRDASPHRLVGSADAAVYAAKRIGRRCALAAPSA